MIFDDNTRMFLSYFYLIWYTAVTYLNCNNSICLWIRKHSGSGVHSVTSDKRNSLHTVYVHFEVKRDHHTKTLCRWNNLIILHQIFHCCLAVDPLLHFTDTSYWWFKLGMLIFQNFISRYENFKSRDSSSTRNLTPHSAWTTHLKGECCNSVDITPFGCDWAAAPGKWRDGREAVAVSNYKVRPSLSCTRVLSDPTDRPLSMPRLITRCGCNCPTMNTWTARVALTGWAVCTV